MTVVTLCLFPGVDTATGDRIFAFCDDVATLYCSGPGQANLHLCSFAQLWLERAQHPVCHAMRQPTTSAAGQRTDNFVFIFSASPQLCSDAVRHRFRVRVHYCTLHACSYFCFWVVRCRSIVRSFVRSFVPFTLYLFLRVLVLQVRTPTFGCLLNRVMQETHTALKMWAVARVASSLARLSRSLRRRTINLFNYLARRSSIHDSLRAVQLRMGGEECDMAVTSKSL
jgi:hypothetical protein